jgi:hypothetical protein
LGGSGNDYGVDIAVDSAGNAYVTGWTDSFGFPATLGAFDTALGGLADAFVTKLAATGALAYSTFLGGTLYDFGFAIAVDSGGIAYVTGYTHSSDFPTTTAVFGTALSGPSDAFVTKLSADGGLLVYSTYIGGVGSEQSDGIAIDDGNAYVTGSTDSSDFPITTGSFDMIYGGAGDAFVTKLATNAASLVYSTYLGGVGEDVARTIAVDSAGVSYVAGNTGSADFATTPGAFDTTLGGTQDAFVATLGVSGATLAYATYLGGANEDYGMAIAIDTAGAAYVSGVSSSGDFPITLDAFDTTSSGEDSFVVKIGEAIAAPDLVETAITNPPAVVVRKQKFAVIDSVHNQGSGAGATTTRYYLSLDTVRNAGDRLLGRKRVVPALASGATSTPTKPVNVTVAVSTPLGVYYLLACADDLSVVVESDEGNNCLASTTTVEVRAPDRVETRDQ